MDQTIQLWLEDKPGVLMRVCGVLTAKGCNIISVIVEPEPGRTGLSSMTVVADVEPRLRTRVVNEMNRLVNVLLVKDVSAREREQVA